MKFLQTQRQVKSINFEYYDFPYAVIKKNREGKTKLQNDKAERDEIYYINNEDSVIPNHQVGIRPRETLLK